ncbi:MAG: NAD-dependent epimerase/dehydratase family protein [Meiothermus silvanus]|nr:NAD-dependent epimerase/dehydratase family protein [Allomeiothermus silvanus]
MPDAPSVLVTGANGFIAHHCIQQLLQHGHKVRGTLRSGVGAGLEFVQADLQSDQGWERAAQGCAYVLHVASPFPPTIPDDENELIVPAREGTLRVLRAAKNAGVRRVVLTSSIAAVMNGHPRPGGSSTSATGRTWRAASSPIPRARP